MLCLSKTSKRGTARHGCAESWGLTSTSSRPEYRIIRSGSTRWHPGEHVRFEEEKIRSALFLEASHDDPLAEAASSSRRATTRPLPSGRRALTTTALFQASTAADVRRAGRQNNDTDEAGGDNEA
ncbi:uncharacterized protein LOC144151587 isoform X2 [Haemaphysalis longicornis]